jgi:hypothetical protein
MLATAPITADQLLPPDVPERSKTGEVLKLEFEVIHGKEKWDPQDNTPEKTSAAPTPKDPSVATPKPRRAELLEQAKKNLPNDEAEAKRLALHAWSVLKLNPGQAALCLSGGGIRSAAFGLGIIQGLAQRGLLGEFHYLSTVSGGGYIASRNNSPGRIKGLAGAA